MSAPIRSGQLQRGAGLREADQRPFGQLSEAQWHHLTETSIVQRADGRWAFRYDPRIAEPFKAAFVDKDIDLWPIYAGITCPTLVVRGAESDLLTRDTWQQMGACGPQTQLAEIPGSAMP